MYAIPLSQELQHFLGPVTFTVEILEDTPTMMEPEPSPFKEGKPLIDVQSWYTDGSSRGQASSWTTIAFQPATDTMWFDSRVDQSSQGDQLRAIWIVAKNEAALLTIYTDSCEVYKGLTLWITS